MLGEYCVGSSSVLHALEVFCGHWVIVHLFMSRYDIDQEQKLANETTILVESYTVCVWVYVCEGVVWVWYVLCICGVGVGVGACVWGCGVDVGVGVCVCKQHVYCCQ